MLLFSVVSSRVVAYSHAAGCAEKGWSLAWPPAVNLGGIANLTVVDGGRVPTAYDIGPPGR